MANVKVKQFHDSMTLKRYGLVLEVEQRDEKVGTLQIAMGGIGWTPAGRGKRAIEISWDDFIKDLNSHC